MNAERLHRILLEVKADYDATSFLDKFRAVRDNLQNQVSQPQQPVYQQNLVVALQALYETLDKSKINDFSPGWTQIINEIGGDNIFGISLKNTVEEIFSSNQITPAAALQDITELVSKSENFKVAIDNLINAYSNLKIGAEELENGECELGYTIPRLFVKNKLNSLNKEISELNFIITTLSEAVTGEKDEFEVKTISSSDFLVYVLVGLHFGKVMSEIVEKIIDNYKKILEIKKLRNELQTHGVPAKETKGIEQHANSLMEHEIEKLVKALMSKYPKKDAPRKNELTNGVTIALNKVANRIDNGFNIEIRVKELTPVEEENESVEESTNAEYVKAIKANMKGMEFIKTSGEPILKLPESQEGK